uniref:Transmembrane protein 192 n=1 Tax=Arion vulgaris TaxID=1028688 RepID=A0A0B6ZSY9_9EUPU
MVSLSNNAAHSRSLYGFSDDHVAINSAQPDDDLIIDHIELISGPEMVNRPIRTTWAILLAIVIYVGLVISAYIIPLECGNNISSRICGEDPLSLILYIHGGIWFTFFGLDRYFHLKHKKNRLNGYLNFYRKTQNVRRMPILINSCANAVMVVLVKVLDSHCSRDSCSKLSQIQWIQIVISIECSAALIFLMVYLVQTVMFNNKKALPDVTQDELSTGVGTAYSDSDLGFRNESYDDQVMEKQADMIRYLKKHTEMLAKRNLTLTEEIYQLKRNR